MRKTHFPLMILLFFTIAACSVQPSPTLFSSPLPVHISPLETVPLSTPSPQVLTSPEQGMANVTGYLIESGSQVPIAGRTVYLAEIIFTDKTHSPIVALDPINNSQTVTQEDGFFSFVNVLPGSYGIMIWTPPNNAVAGIDPAKGDIAMLEAKENQTVTLGNIITPPDFR